jgi:hypothetical protein
VWYDGGEGGWGARRWQCWVWATAAVGWVRFLCVGGDRMRGFEPLRVVWWMGVRGCHVGSSHLVGQPSRVARAFSN